MSHLDFDVDSEHNEMEEIQEQEIRTDHSVSEAIISSKQSSVKITEHSKIERKPLTEEFSTPSEERNIENIDVSDDLEEHEYSASFELEASLQLKETEDRDFRPNKEAEIEESNKEKGLIFSTKSSDDDLIIPVSELDRRLEYFAHIWLLHRKSIEPAKMLDKDPEDVLLIYETNHRRIENDFIRLKKAIKLGEIPTWHKRKFAEYIVPREVMPTYIEPTSGETIIPDQNIIQETEDLIESFVKGLPE
jgi:hypothetical protein